MVTSHAQKALYFHSLHNPRAPLALSNAWDVASALIAEAAGAPAIATTSAGAAWSLGFPDGQRLDRQDAVAVVERITNAVAVPVTADIEGGYAQSGNDIAETIKRVIGAGAVGINIEDGGGTPEELAELISAARQVAEGAGIRLFINARTDVFLTGSGVPEQLVNEAISRAARYVAAGADGIFVPGVSEGARIAELTAVIPVPLNVMAGPGMPSVSELGRLGVARVSLGSGVAQAAYTVAQRAAEELVATGTYTAVEGALDYGTLNGRLAQAGVR